MKTAISIAATDSKDVLEGPTLSAIAGERCACAPALIRPSAPNELEHEEQL